MVPLVHEIGQTGERSSASHNRLTIIVYNISYSALSSPMNILSTVGGFGLMKLAELDSLVV